MRPVETAAAPRAIGPYSQAMEARPERMLFLSGQIPLDPDSGEMVSGDIAAETRRVLANLAAVLAAAHMAPANVARTTIFLTDMKDFAIVNQVYGEFFADHRPARATVQVAALPRGARVEIDAIAVAP